MLSSEAEKLLLSFRQELQICFLGFDLLAANSKDVDIINPVMAGRTRIQLLLKEADALVHECNVHTPTLSNPPDISSAK